MNIYDVEENHEAEEEDIDDLINQNLDFISSYKEIPQSNVSVLERKLAKIE